MRLYDLDNDLIDSIRAHHASGHFSTEEATARLMGGLSMSADEAAQVLARPVDAELFYRFQTFPPGMRAIAV